MSQDTGAVGLWEILVPCHRNDGRPYRVRHHRQWDTQVLRVTGGLTILKPTTAGYWFGDPVFGEAVLYKDRMIPVRIAATDRQMKEIIRRTLNHYPDQEAVMAYKISDEVRLVHRNAAVRR